MTTDLRARIAEALEAADYRAPMRRGDLADAVVPVVQAELDRLRTEALREAADHFVAHCFTHTPGLHHGYMQCHCEAATELRALAKEQP